MTPAYEQQLGRSIFRDALDAFLILCPGDLRIVDANPAALRLTGWRRKQFLSMTLSDLIACENEADWQKLVSGCRSEEPFSVDRGFALKLSDGRRLPVQVSASRIHMEPDPLGLLIVRDISRQRNAEEEIEEAHQFSKQIVTGLREGLVVYDRNLRYLLWNRYMEELSGLPAEAVMGNRPWELFPILREQGIERYLNRALAGETVLVTEIAYHMYQTGRKGWAAAHYGPLRNLRGETVGVIASVRDITKRKRATALLAGEAAALGLLGEGAPLPVILDALVRTAEETTDGMLASVLLLQNGKLCHGAARSLPKAYVQAIDGVQIGPCVGSCGTAAFRAQPVIVSDISIDPLWANFRELALGFGLRACWSTPILSGGRVLGTFALYYHEPRSPTSEEESTIERLTRLVRIAIERKEAEETLRQNETYLRAIIDNEPECLKVLSADGTVLEMNAAGLQMLEVENAEDCLGRCAFNLIAPEHRDAFRAMHQRVIAGHKANLEFEMIGLGGTRRWMDTRGVALERGEGRETLALYVTRDITERKLADEQRRRVETQMLHAQKLESLGVLAGGIAHDFNNLLTGILGYASLARMHLSGDSPAGPMLQEIERGAERAAELAHQMLAYSGKGKFVIRAVALDAMVKEMASLLQTVVSKKAVLHLDLSASPLEGDATQIRQVIMNLITNASDSLNGEEGVIVLRTGTAHFNRAALRSPYLPGELPEGVYAFVEVRDSGCGMSPETQQKLFDPFFTTKFAGRGLGLAAVLGIVRSHRGTLHVSSSPGSGSSFQVLFPTIATTAEFAVAPKKPPRTGKGWILVVEDDPSIRALVCGILESAGFNVASAADGSEGTEIFAKGSQEFVGIVLDLTMPRMDGLEAARQFNRLRPGVPILLMSGYHEQENTAKFEGAGISRFVQKPFRPDDLVNRVCEMVLEVRQNPR